MVKKVTFVGVRGEIATIAPPLLYVNKGGYSSNCKIVLAEFLHSMEKYTLPFNKPVKSVHN